ncbi:MAG: chromosomal replication initiator protein DnaA [Bacilli bacterium]|nr:chromosomal replication initiator protein DnaA [Bacilli bacterium]
MNTENLWKNFLAEVAEEVSPTTYQVWFNDLILLKIEQNIIKIQVPMEIHKKMLGNTYYNLIENIFYNLTNTKYDIKFVLEDDSIFTEEEIVEKEAPETTYKVYDTNLNKNLNFENFVVGNTNRLAYISARAVAEAPGKIHNPLFLYGKSGLGKTHLMHAIGNYIVETSKKRVLYVTSEDFMTDFTGIADITKNANSFDYANEFKNKYRNVDVLIIDDIQYLVGADRTQQEFFNTFNSLHKMGKQIIISSDRSPDDLKKLEERLRSRFMWGLPVDIYPPDFDLRCRIIRSKIAHTSIAKKIDDAVVEYIANACQNDVRHIEGTINRLMAYTAMIVPDKIDLEFACEALKDYVSKNIYASSNIEKIQKAVASYYGITVEDLKGKKRSNKIAYPRQLGMYLCRMETNETFPKIGLEFGGRDHSTVIFACDKIEKELKQDAKLQVTINEIKNRM